jgi:hypothetical protein
VGERRINSTDLRRTQTWRAAFRILDLEDDLISPNLTISSGTSEASARASSVARRTFGCSHWPFLNARPSVIADRVFTAGTWRTLSQPNAD